MARRHHGTIASSLLPDPYKKGEEGSIYVRIKGESSGGYCVLRFDWDSETVIDHTGPNDGARVGDSTGTYKTIEIDEYVWMSENLRIAYRDRWSTWHEFVNNNQSQVDAVLGVNVATREEFVNHFGAWTSQLVETTSYFNKTMLGNVMGYKVTDAYDLSNTLPDIPSWKLPSSDDILQLVGQAPRETGDVFEDAKNFLCCSPKENYYNLASELMNKKNVSGLTLVASGSRQNVSGSPINGFGLMSAIKTDSPLRMFALSNYGNIGLGALFGDTYHMHPARYCRRKTDEELGYKLYIDEVNDTVLMLPHTAVSTLPELERGLPRGVALRYANRKHMKILKSWTEIQSEAAEITSHITYK